MVLFLLRLHYNEFSIKTIWYYGLVFRDIGLRLTRCQYSAQHHSIWAKMIKVICWIFHTLWLARSFGQKLRKDHTVCIWSLSLTLSILWRMLLSISHSYLWTHWTHCGIPIYDLWIFLKRHLTHYRTSIT